MANELKFSKELKDSSGDQRIDVVVRGPPSYKPRAIDEIAVKTRMSVVNKEEERHRTENNPAAIWDFDNIESRVRPKDKPV